MHKRPPLVGQTSQSAPAVQLGRQRLVRERYIDQLSHQACALYLFLLTVATRASVTTPTRPSASACP